MNIQDLPQRSPGTSAGVASLAPGARVKPGRIGACAQISPIAGVGRYQPRGIPPQANAGAPSSGGHRLKTIAVAVLAAVLVLVTGCDAGGREEQVGQDEGHRGGETQESSSVPKPENGDEAPELGDDGFVASAESSGGEAGTADRIEGVRFQIFDDYERLLIDFGGRDGEAAGVPRWFVESPAEGGYVRVRFPGVTSTAITGEDLVGSVLNEMYVVRDRGGGLFADVFGLHEFRYRIRGFPESGRLAVDFRGEREELDLPPTTSDKAVVVQPREAEEVSSPLTVEGYARLFEGRVTVSLLDREREVISTETVRANDWATAWGLFEATLEVPDYEGRATLRVGGESPRDGSFVGTETEVFIE